MNVLISARNSVVCFHALSTSSIVRFTGIFRSEYTVLTLSTRLRTIPRLMDKVDSSQSTSLRFEQGRSIVGGE
jgi:hypothetical protein